MRTHGVRLFCFQYLQDQSRKGGKDQESIQSSTTPDPGYHMEKWQKHNQSSQTSQEASPFPAGDHKAAMNRRESMTNTIHYFRHTILKCVSEGSLNMSFVLPIKPAHAILVRFAIEAVQSHQSLCYSYTQRRLRVCASLPCCQLTSWLLFVMFNCLLSLSHVVSWVRCGTWLHRFMIFATFPTMIPCAGPEGGGGGGQEVWIPLKNHQNIVLHCNIGPDPLTNQKATKPAFHDGPLIFGIWILPPIINLKKKPLSKLDPLWQNSLDPRIDPDL